VGLRGSLRALALGVGLAFLAGTGTATAAGVQCGNVAGLLCSTVVVPLDRTGVVPGTISLHVEELPPPGNDPSRGAIFLIAGGPGQGSAQSFDLGDQQSAALFRFLFPGYTLVAYDDRGTGDSGLLNCPALQVSTSPTGQDLLAAQCAASLGASVPFYGTADHAADLDAVRAALGFDKIALYGVSYGTKLALAYSYAYPQHVELMVLDSILPTTQPDPYASNVARSMPGTLAAFCASVCNNVTPDFAGEVVSVANSLAAKPAHGSVLLANGKTTKDTLDGTGLLSLIVDADLNPGLAVELPAAVHAARYGYMAPLLRLHVIDDRGSVESAIDLSAALYAATDCRDGPFPWPADSAPSSRPALLQQAVAALPPGTFGPFGSWAYQLGNASFCDTWPTPAGGADLAVGPPPNVPVLGLSGGFDMRTPTADARGVIDQFPQGKLLVVPGVGHSVTTTDPSGCAALAVHDWMLNPTSTDTCSRPPFLVRPVADYPSPIPTKTRASAATTFTIARKTLLESEAMWLDGDLESDTTLPGLTSGKLVPVGSTGYKLVAYGLVSGISVSGTVKIPERRSVALNFEGTFTVGGRAATPGTLQLTTSGVDGRIGKRSFGLAPPAQVKHVGELQEAR
jgi:pimeloyl-ACP methyl ester carboxylesterase